MSPRRQPDLSSLGNATDSYRRRAQSAQLEVALLRQRLVEMQAQSRAIQGRLRVLQRAQASDTAKLRRLGALKQRVAQRKQSREMLEKRRTAQRAAQRNARHARFETQVLDALQIVEKDRDWKRIKRSLNAKRASGRR
jgi:hypothetical protein